MRGRWTGAARAAGAAMVAGLAMATSGWLSAQQNNGSQAQPSIMVDEKSGVAPAQSPQSPKPAKSKRARVQTPAARAEPRPRCRRPASPLAGVAAAAGGGARSDPHPNHRARRATWAQAAGKPPRANSNLVVACSGATVAKDSNHLKLTMALPIEERELHRGRGRLGQAIRIDPLSDGCEEAT